MANAGAGKTSEIRNTCRQLRAKGHSAFFVRIENIVSNLEDSFEEGSYDQFLSWVGSGSEGWLFLDSVDEARLKDPKDFERAIKKIGRLLVESLQNCHIMIAGRISAWRPTTDLLICENAIAYTAPIKSTSQDYQEALDLEFDVVDGDNASKPAERMFKIVGLDDMRDEQIERFVRGQGLTEVQPFLLAVQRADAGSLTTRPQDLAELVDFWKKSGTIGSRFELMRNSVERRLIERDQDRSEARPLSTDRARKAVRLVAAAATLTHQSEIRVPDGDVNTRGIAVKDVLTDWDDVDCLTLLNRPIFDEGIYGTVRFHHRSVREYLTAEWLHSLIVDQASRSRIEDLFFKVQYDIEVIVPTMRPILPWLALLDEQILDRVCRLSPEVVLEGGDPARLPLSIRQEILKEVCEKLAEPAHGHSFDDYSAVQRFATPDLTPDIKALLARYGNDDSITWFLLRMIWQGVLTGALNEVLHFSIESRSKYTRIAALRALGAIGSPQSKVEARNAFLTESDELNRDWLSEFCADLPTNSTSVDWLLSALEKSATRNRFEIDNLTDEVLNYITRLPKPLLPRILAGLQRLLESPPFFEQKHGEISTRFSWLANAVAQCLLRLIENRDPSLFDNTFLAALRLLPVSRDYVDREHKDLLAKLPAAVANWPELNQALFWYDVMRTREAGRGDDEGVKDFWHVGIFGRYWSFSKESFDSICEEVRSREFLDDRLVALSVAFAIYVQEGRPTAWRKRLKDLAGREKELASALDAMLHPPKSALQWKRREARWKREAESRKEKEEANRQDWKSHLAANIGSLRSPGAFTNEQYYLFQRLREHGNRGGKWTNGRWEYLIPEFGEAVARAFKDGAVAHWRNYRPKLPSEDSSGDIPFALIFGLAGLAIESRENLGWAETLGADECDIAVRYALKEMNGFPDWFPKLHSTFPDIVTKNLIREIDHELAEATRNKNSHGVLSDLGWTGQWTYNSLGPYVLSTLTKATKNLKDLVNLLTILNGSSVTDADIAKVASRKSLSTKDSAFAPIWYATWVGVDPGLGIPALAARVGALLEDSQKTLFAMRFIMALVGGGHTRASARSSFRSIDHMKTIYLLMNRYIHEKDDIERAGTGVYTPEMRDHAQDARNSLFAFMKEMPGKEAYLALKEISRSHPSESSRPWMAFHAKAKATTDADISPWSPSDVREFNTKLERTPANHRELWELAIDRLNDLKMDLEEGDSSIASILQPIDLETEIRKYIGNWCRDKAGNRYVIPQEEELADKKRPDLRFQSMAFDGPVPAELKLADKWTGPHLFERLEIQLCGDYLRDRRSSRGIFLLVYHGTKQSWDLPSGTKARNFSELCVALQNHWVTLANVYPGVEDIRVIGIDLTKRGIDAKAAQGARELRSDKKSKGKR
ncbi:hypothetical protein GGE68_003226 [Rhizobium leguminosarum]|uniref:NACHT domain-containing protein n=1 Tax=Rhizobium leguminosarum TaxID=384 RepID=UPI001607D9CB|nr:hypothetical protein [Rhizobium leguminosarum]MBB5665029.1 hypothetical protein [Rhizobium leguminosarum]